jgi:hypothetical protein
MLNLDHTLAVGGHDDLDQQRSHVVESSWRCPQQQQPEMGGLQAFLGYQQGRAAREGCMGGILVSWWTILLSFFV